MNCLVLFDLSHLISLHSHPIYANVLSECMLIMGEKYTWFSKFRENLQFKFSDF